MKLEVPFTTLIKITFFLLLCVIVVKVWPVIMMIIVAALIAVMVDPVVEWLARHRVRRGFGIAIAGVVMFGLLAAFLLVVVPITVNQMKDLGKQLPRLVEEVSRRVPAVQPYVAPLAQMAKQPPNGAQMQQWLMHGLIAGRFALTAIAALTLTLVIAIYLLIEGRRAQEWLIVFAHGSHREKLRRTMTDVQPIVFAYMRGQAITCALCGGMALTTLTLLHIPAAVPLAVLAFIADLVPIVGTVVMIAPAVLLALVVSPLKAFIVLAVYLARLRKGNAAVESHGSAGRDDRRNVAGRDWGRVDSAVRCSVSGRRRNMAAAPTRRYGGETRADRTTLIAVVYNLRLSQGAFH